MALPYSGAPHILKADDVFAAEHAEKVKAKLNDARLLIEGRHYVTGTPGRHSGIEVPVAVAFLIPSDSTGWNGQTVFHKGFRRAPTWSNNGYTVNVEFELVPSVLEWWGGRVIVEWSGTSFEDECMPLVIRPSHSGATNLEGGCMLGVQGNGRLQYIDGLSIVIYGRRKA